MSRTFGKNLKNYRMLAEMSMQDLANATGIGRSSINNYERSVAEPSFENLCTIARVLGVEITDLVEERESYPDYVMRVQVTDEESALLQAYREADPVYQNVALEILRSHRKEEK